MNIFVKKRISKDHFKEHQHNNLCKLSLTKSSLKKREMNDFEEKKNDKGPKIMQLSKK